MGVFSELQERGVIYQVSSPELERALDNEKLSIYVGFDPTADSLTVGNLLQIVTMRRLQLYGHRPVFVAGGATGMIGDPSGRSSERNLLSEDVISYNLACVSSQLARYLDFESSDSSALLVNNSTWFKDMGLLEFLTDVGKSFSVSTMLQRDSVRSRLGDQQSLSFTEFSYMLLQAYDFYQLSLPPYDVRVQFGGSDQWGNIVAGIDYVRRVSGKTVFGATTPLVTKSDGTKFGKSAGNAVWLDPKKTTPYELYQFFIRSEDEMVGTYLRYFTLLSLEEIRDLEEELKTHPERRSAHGALAFEVTAFVHGREEAIKAQRASTLLYQGRLDEAPKDILMLALTEAPKIEIAKETLAIDPVDLLSKTPLVSSKSEAARTVRQGGFYVNDRKRSEGEAVTDADLIHDELIVLRRGKKDYCLVRVI
jgi:tyrosyl-tRNA synthetase